MEKAFFLLFAAVAVGSGLLVVVSRNPIHSALALMVSLVQVAAIFVLLGSPFLAAIQIFVYVGAVMVLFLFVIMMLDVHEEARTRFLKQGTATALTVVGLLGIEMLALLFGSGRLAAIATSAGGARADTLRQLSRALFNEYLWPFEVASVVLLVALIGAIVLARKEAD
ncbi:MAG: NADH-quinone oxidoreductase subunit J [Sphingomonadales bacterium]